MAFDSDPPDEPGRLLDRFVDNLPGLAYRCAPEPPWEMTFLRGRVERLTGYPSAAFERNEVTYGDLVVDDDLGDLTRAVEAGIDARRQFTATYRIRTKAGDVKHVFERGVPVVDDGTVTTLEGIVIDISRRKAYERCLERRNDIFAHTQRMAVVGGWELDVRTDELRWTDQVNRIHGLPLDASPTVEEALDFYHPEDRPIMEDAVEAALRDGEPFDHELRIVTDHGEQRWIRARGVPQLADGEPVRLRGAIQDITGLKDRERLLQVLHRLLRHNIRNDLTTIRGYADTLAEALSDDELRGYVDDVDAAAKDLLTTSETAKQMVDLILESTGETKILDLGEVVEHVAGGMRERYPGASITVSVEGSVEVECHPRIEAVFEQLVENGIEHNSSSSPRVEVGVFEQAGEACVEVVDDGPGMVTDEWTMVEEELRDEPTQLQHGSGIGLLLARWTVDELGGSLQYADRDGGGSVVTVRLPSAE